MTAREYELLLPWFNAGIGVVLDLEPDPTLLRKKMLDQVEGGYVLSKDRLLRKAERLSDRGYLGTRLLTPLDSPEGDEGEM